MKYIVGRLTQISFWFGILVTLFALFATRGEQVLLGIVMLFVHDEFIKNTITSWAPGLSKWIAEIVEDL